MTSSKPSPRDLQSESGPGASGAQKTMKKYEILFWNVFLVDFGQCFVTILKFWRFPELLTTPSESSPRDLQSESGPGASGAQK